MKYESIPVSRVTLAIALLITALAPGCAVDRVSSTGTGAGWSLPRKVSATQYYTSEGSLWQDGTAANLLFADARARMVNDLLTIIVLESGPPQ